MPAVCGTVSETGIVPPRIAESHPVEKQHGAVACLGPLSLPCHWPEMLPLHLCLGSAFLAFESQLLVSPGEHFSERGFPSGRLVFSGLGLVLLAPNTMSWVCDQVKRVGRLRSERPKPCRCVVVGLGFTYYT